MSVLAIQTDSRGVTAVLADRPQAGKAAWSGCATVPLSDDPSTLVDTLKAALPGLRGKRPDVFVALGTEEARVRRLPVPAAPPEELPAIIAMQAAREATAEVEEIVADFLPPDGSAEETFVAWCDATKLAFWEEVAAKLGGKLQAATPRPLATLALAGGGVTVLVSRAGDALDFAAASTTTANNGAPSLLRSVYLGEGDASVISRELSRTLLSLGDADPQVLHAEPSPDADQRSIDWQTIAGRLGTDGNSLRACHASAAVGLLITATNSDTPSINLADPRRPPVVETGRRRQVLLGATAATVLFAASWMAYQRVADLDRQIEAKRAEIEEATEAVEAFEPYRNRVAAIDAWRASDVTWLDEIERLGRKLRPVPLDGVDFPEDSDVRLTQVRATSLTSRGESGGKIELAAAARSSSTRGLEARLRDDRHPVEPISIAENPSKDAYRFDYNALLRSPAAGEEAGEEEGAEADKQSSEEPAAEDVP